VAHDFNNLLMGIMGYTDLCRAELPADHPIRGYLDEIVTEVQRSADLTRQLLAFARRQTIDPKVLDLNGAVGGILKMLRRLIGEDINLSWKPGITLWPVKMDPSQIDQILTNLCVNGRDAVAAGGTIVVETSNSSLDQAYCVRHAGAVPGDYVMLAVSDDGRGMDPKTLKHVFEPFFTTKGVGKGTGLGLATVYGIVKQNKGYISAYSEPGHGTTFKVYLPRYEGADSATVVRTETAVPCGHGETVLVVEDEKSLRVTCRQFLERLGYRALVAESPAEALDLAARHPGKIDLLLTDVVMPDMNGRELAERMGTIRPGLTCLYMSGYTADVIAHHGVLDEGMQFISKPFTRDDLARKLHAILGEDGRSSPAG
jgi:CheY-like chemotaxis protein